MKNIILLFIILLAFFGSVNAQISRTLSKSTDSVAENKSTGKDKIDTSNINLVSNGYYSWRITGNPTLDMVSMQVAAEKFKNEHPDIYAKIACDGSKILQIEYDDFISMSKEKQQLILSHPEKYKVLPKEKAIITH